jgi:hypothetical protein
LGNNSKNNSSDKSVFLRYGRRTKRGNWNCKKLRLCYKLQTKLAHAILLSSTNSSTRITFLRNKMAKKCSGINQNASHRGFFDVNGCFGKLQDHHIQIRNLIMNKNSLFTTWSDYLANYQTAWGEMQSTITGICAQEAAAITNSQCKTAV